MKILHICSGWKRGSEVAEIARLCGAGEERHGHEVSCRVWPGTGDLRSAGEVWIHGAWSLCLWRAAFHAKKYKWMPSGGYGPLRLRGCAAKRFFFSAIERFFLRRASAVVALCPAEEEWIRAFEPRVKTVEPARLGRFFPAPEEIPPLRKGRALHLLYFGGRRESDGYDCLMYAAAEGFSGVSEKRRKGRSRRRRSRDRGPVAQFELRDTAEFRRRDRKQLWQWCDYAVFPGVECAFAIPVAKALAHGKRAIVTDGAPAWRDGLVPLDASGELFSGLGGRILYVKGYKNAAPFDRARLLRKAIDWAVENRAPAEV